MQTKQQRPVTYGQIKRRHSWWNRTKRALVLEQEQNAFDRMYVSAPVRNLMYQHGVTVRKLNRAQDRIVTLAGQQRSYMSNMPTPTQVRNAMRQLDTLRDSMAMLQRHHVQHANAGVVASIAAQISDTLRGLDNGDY